MSFFNIRCIKTLSVLTVAIFGLSACTSGLLARNLDWLVERYVGEYFDLRDDQSDLLVDLLNDSTQRSSNNSIPALISLLDTAISLHIDNELSREMPRLAEEFQTLGNRLSEDNSHNLIKFALSIDDAQRQQIAEQLQHRNDKYAKKHIAPGQQARREAFSKDVQRNAKRWLGRRSTEQQALLEQYVAQYRLNEAQWLESREAWQQEFLKALALADDVLKKQRLRTLIDTPETTFSAQQQADSEFNNALSIQLLQSMLDSSSAKQREQIQKQLLKLRKRVSGFHQALSYSANQFAPGLYAFAAN